MASPARAAVALDLDRLARQDTRVHRLDPRAKTIAALAIMVAIARVPPEDPRLLSLLACPILLYAAAGRVPLGFLAARAAVVLPFLAFFVATAPLLPGPLEENLYLAGFVVLKAYLSVAAATALAATTPWHRLLQGLERLRVPRPFVLVLQFLHRYVFVLVERVQALRRARDARLAARPAAAALLSAGSGMIGALFLRTLERAERIEAAMASRGFDGEVRTLDALRFGPADAAFAAGGVAIAVMVGLL